MAENVMQCSHSVSGVVHRSSDMICVYNTEVPLIEQKNCFFPN